MSPAPSGGTPAPGVAVLPGSTATELIFGAGVGSTFSAGCLIAVDVDYQQQTGYVGSGIAAAYVSSPAAVKQDPNYVRRVTFNVGRVAEVTATSVVLAQPLLGGVPAAGASAQVVVAFVDREGGSFFQEWSALFVAEDESGRTSVLLLSAAEFGKRQDFRPGNSCAKSFTAIEKPLSAISLRASFLALPLYRYE